MSYTLINPATEEQMETIAHADLAQTDAAIELASKAQKKGTKAKQTKKAGPKAKKPVVVQRSLMTRSRRVTMLK